MSALSCAAETGGDICAMQRLAEGQTAIERRSEDAGEAITGARRVDSIDRSGRKGYGPICRLGLHATFAQSDHDVDAPETVADRGSTGGTTNVTSQELRLTLVDHKDIETAERRFIERCGRSKVEHDTGSGLSSAVDECLRVGAVGFHLEQDGRVRAEQHIFDLGLPCA